MVSVWLLHMKDHSSQKNEQFNFELKQHSETLNKHHNHGFGVCHLWRFEHFVNISKCKPCTTVPAYSLFSGTKMQGVSRCRYKFKNHQTWMAFWKYIGAISPISFGNGTHSIIMCGCCLRDIADSKKTQSSSSDLITNYNCSLQRLTHWRFSCQKLLQRLWNHLALNK